VPSGRGREADPGRERVLADTQGLLHLFRNPRAVVWPRSVKRLDTRRWVSVSLSWLSLTLQWKRVMGRRIPPVPLATGVAQSGSSIMGSSTWRSKCATNREGTPRELKQRLAGETVVLRPKLGARPPGALLDDLSREPYVHDARVDGEPLRLAVSNGTESLPEIFELLRARGVSLETVSLSEPSLDDVFLRKTGRSLRDAGEAVVA
jgi:Domain of unknown function (DUF4162)